MALSSALRYCLTKMILFSAVRAMTATAPGCLMISRLPCFPLGNSTSSRTKSMIFPLYNSFDDNVFLQSPSILSAPRSTFTFTSFILT